MLPSFSKLSLTPTGEFYALTLEEAGELNANDGQDPISLDPYLVAQGKDSNYATFRVHVRDSKGNWIDKFYVAIGLWEWVRRPNGNDPPTATIPDSRQLFWREDWWSLSDRFAPGVVYPHWVRNLPQLDPSKSDTKTYAPSPANPEEAAEMQAFQAEGHTLLDDVATFALSLDFLQAVPSAYHITNVDTNIQQLIRGFDHGNYLAEFDSATNDEAYQFTARAMHTLLTMTPAVTSAAVPLLLLKASVLEFMYKGFSRRTLRERFPSLITHVNTYLQSLTQRAGNTNPFSPDVEIRAVYNSASLAAHYVKHFYYWDGFIQPTLVRPPRTMTERPSWARPLHGPELLGLAQMMDAMTSVADTATGLLRVGGSQFFDTGDDVRFIDRVRQLGTMFLGTRDWPSTGEVRALAIRFFTLVLSLTPELRPVGLALNSEAAVKPVRVAAALHHALANAIRVSDYEYQVEDDNPNTRKLNAFFWRYVAPLYTEGTWTQQDRGDIESFLNEIVINWTEGEEVYDSDGESDDGSVGSADDTPIPAYLLEESEGENSDADLDALEELERVEAVARHNMRPRAGRSGETPNPRRQRNA